MNHTLSGKHLPIDRIGIKWYNIYIRLRERDKASPTNQKRVASVLHKWSKSIMSIEGRIISKVGNEVHIKQFFTGYVYRCDLSKVSFRGTPNNPEKTDDGYLIGKCYFLDGKLIHY